MCHRWLLVLALVCPSAAHGNALIDAARDGKAALALRLIAQGLSVTETGQQGDTALHWAAFNGQIAVARALLKNGADVDARVSNGNTPLHQAAYAGHLDMVELLLNAGASARSRNRNNLTPAQWAARNGHAKVVARLEPGARPAPAPQSGTPQRSVVMRSHTDEQLSGRAAARANRRLNSLSPSIPPAAEATPRKPLPKAPTEAAESLPVPPPKPSIDQNEPEAWAQLGAFDAPGAARRHWAQLRARVAEPVASAEPVVVNASVGDRRFHRLRLGPMPRSRAQRTCKTVVAAKFDCLVILRKAPR